MFYFCSVFKLSHAVYLQREDILCLGICLHAVTQDCAVCLQNKVWKKLHLLTNKFGLSTKNLKRKAAYAGLKDLIGYHRNQKRRLSKFMKNSCKTLRSVLCHRQCTYSTLIKSVPELPYDVQHLNCSISLSLTW